MTMLKDFKDNGANTNSEEVKVSQVILVALPAVLGLASILTGFWTSMFSGFPYLLLWVKFMLSAMLCLLAAVLIITKRPIYTATNSFLQDPSLHSKNKQRLQEYVYAQTLRKSAKLLMMPLLLLTLWTLWISLPCGLFEKAITGMIIRIDHEKIVNGTVQIQGVAGDMISQQIEPLDDRHFFYSDLRWWASKPAKIIFKANGCPLQTIDIDDGKAVAEKSGIFKNWIVNCN